MASRHDVVFHPFTSDVIRRKAKRLCRRPGFSRSDEEDLQQGMVLYLWTKAELFDAKRGNIEAFVTTVIDSWVGMELRRRAREKRRAGASAISIEGTLVQCDGDFDPLAAVLSEADGVRRIGGEARSLIEGLMMGDTHRTVITALTRRERALLRDVIEHGGVAGAARIRKISRRKVEAALAAIRARLSYLNPPE